MDIRIEHIHDEAALTAAAWRIYKVDARCPALVIRNFKIPLLSISHIMTPFIFNVVCLCCAVDTLPVLELHIYTLRE